MKKKAKERVKNTKRAENKRETGLEEEDMREKIKGKAK
jgi:hypothetical protein